MMASQTSGLIFDIDGILFQSDHKVGVLESFSDANFAGDVETRRSTSGVVCKLVGGAVSWTSQKQKSVSLSTTEAELMAVSEAAKEVIWLNRLLGEISHLEEQPVLGVDSASAIKLIKNPEFHKRTKHIEVKTLFREREVLGRCFQCGTHIWCESGCCGDQGTTKAAFPDVKKTSRCDEHLNSD